MEKQVIVKSKKKFNDFFVLFVIDGSFNIVISKDNVKEGKNIKV